MSRSYNSMAYRFVGSNLDGYLSVSGVLVLLPNIAIFSTLPLLDAALEEQFTAPLNKIVTIAAVTGVSAFVSFTSLFFAMVYLEKQLASESLRLNQPIGEVIQCEDDAGINHSIGILRNSSWFSPNAVKALKEHLMDYLSIATDVPVDVKTYTLQDVINTNVIDWATASYTCLMLMMSTLWIAHPKMPDSAFAALCMIMFLTLTPISVSLCSKVSEAAVSHYSNMHNTQFEGCFFSRTAASIRENLTPDSDGFPLVGEENSSLETPFI
ncbi:MAG: hypothetical protein P1U36_10165 [Legionellaceae bacterium]|nr:hypothetical protein [Legionellaceae bacterium]